MSEKVFTKKMTLSICLILLCLCALSISAGAFFSDTTKSNTKTFQTATYDLTIAATKQETTVDNTDPTNPVETVNTNVPVGPIGMTTDELHSYNLTVLPVVADNAAGYDIVVSIKDGITATSSSGYCKIVIVDANDPSVTFGPYYTKQIAVAEYAAADITTSRSLKIVTRRNILVKFIPLWGTYSGTPLADNDVIDIPAPSNP